jgi:hypothetical protein
MNSQNIRSLIENEIGGNWDQSNAHGIDLRTCLVTPERRRYIDAGGRETIELWLVLEEDPSERKGYKIVFDESAGRFGLATTQQNGPDVFLGLYGSFMKTLEAM